MSVTQFVDIPEIRDRLKALRPKTSRKIGHPILVLPKSKRYSQIGTAFDYLLRFELKRRIPLAVEAPWVAEAAISKIWERRENGIEVSRDILKDVPPDLYRDPRTIADRGHELFAKARLKLEGFYSNKRPGRTTYEELARYAVVFAKLDVFFRAGQLDPRFDTAEKEDVEEICDLINVVPFDEIPIYGVYLNPTFAESSVLIGGTDADLIAGDLLIDIKTTVKDSMNPRDLDQLLAYFILARNQRKIDNSYPNIERIGFYFSRQGRFWIQPKDIWTNNENFGRFEDWFIAAADEYYSQPVRLKRPDGSFFEIERRSFNL